MQKSGIAHTRGRRLSFLKTKSFSFIMRVSFFFIAGLIYLSQIIVAAPGYGQNNAEKIIRLDFNNVPLLTVFNSIETQSGVVISYETSLIKALGRVSVHQRMITVGNALDLFLKDRGLQWKMTDNVVLISAKIIPGDPAPPSLFTQQIPVIRISGTVTGANNRPLAGATVRLKGKDIFTSTNDNGYFELTVETGSTLIVSYIGYVQKEVRVNHAGPITVMLEQAMQFMDTAEVVINTGYQKIPKERATGSYTVITAKELERRTAPSLLTIIEGMAPGLLISKSSNGIENQDNPSILMRGVSTFGNQQPLIVVDGFPIEGDISSVNPNDVETVTVLRDAAAAAIWGVKATNGVIVINTKKGKTFAPKVTFRSSYNLDARPDLSYLRLMNSAQMVDYEKSVFYVDPLSLPRRNTGTYRRNAYTPVYAILMDYEAGTISAEKRDELLGELAAYNNTDEISGEFLNRNYSSDNTVSISAAPNDRFSYYASFGYLAGSGLYKGDDLRKSNVNFNADLKLAKQLTLTVGANYTAQERSISQLKRIAGSSNSSVPGTLKLLPYERLRNADGTPRNIDRVYNPEIREQFRNSGFVDMEYSPLAEIDAYENSRKENTLRLQAALNYRIHKSVSLNVSYKSESINGLYSDLSSPTAYETRDVINNFTSLNGTSPVFNIPKGSILSETRPDITNYYLRGQIDVNHAFNANHRVDITAGIERQKSVSQSTKDTRFGFNPNNNLSFPVNLTSLANLGIYNPLTALSTQLELDKYFNKSTVDDRYIFYYFAGSYVFKNKYTFSTSARINKSSRFDRAAGLNKQILASAGVKWDILKEGFMSTSSLTLLQLRYTAGLTGNVPDLTTSSMRTIGFPFMSLNTNTTYLSVQTPANKNLRWEPTLTHNLAVDFGFLRGRINGSVDLYHKKTTDLLGSDAINPTLTGFYFVPLNSADITNKGVEVRLTSVNINAKRFRWQSTLNFGYNDNKVGFSTTNRNGAIGAPRNITGYPSRTFFALQWAGLDAQGRGLVYDVQADGTKGTIPASSYQNLTFEDYVEIGSVIPKYTTGLSNILTFGNWDFSFLFIANGGHYLRTDIISDRYFNNSFGGSGFVNLPVAIASIWRVPGDENKTNIPRYNSFNNNQYNWSDINYQSAAFIKLREVALSYLFDKKMLGSLPVSNIKLNFQVRNAWKWVKNDRGIDPEAYILTSGERTIPITATYTFGVFANF